MSDLRLALRQLLKSPGSPPSRCCRSRSASAPTPRSSAWSTTRCCARCRSAARTSSSSCGTSKASAGGCRGPARTTARSIRSPGGTASTSFSLLAFERMQARHPALTDLFAFAPFSQVNVLVDGQPEIEASAQLVSGTYYAGLGVSPALGRLLTPEDDRAGAAPVAVISYRYWQRRFAGDARRAGPDDPRQPRPRDDRRRHGATDSTARCRPANRPTSRSRSRHYLLFQPNRSGAVAARRTGGSG